MRNLYRSPLTLLALAPCLLPLACATQGAQTQANLGSSPQGTPAAGNNLLKNSAFDAGSSLPWTSSFSDPAHGDTEIVEGAYCLNLADKGKNPWDAQVRHREMILEQGHSYAIRFTAKSNQPTKLRAKIGMAGPPYAEYWNSTIEVGPQARVFQGGFSMGQASDPTAEFAFHMGGNLAGGHPLQVCIDNVTLTDPEFHAKSIAAAAPNPLLRVNQVGYFPKGPKIATLVSPATEAVSFVLTDADGKVLFEGKSDAIGLDKDSGEPLHTLDFSAFHGAGQNLRLRVGEEQSPAFTIADNLYSTLRIDALNYFYQNRSGIELKLPFARKADWVRPAGHLADKSVPCAPDSGCSYSLDVSGGWYDAGDFGKYVVNGGISVWTLFNQFERTERRTPAAVAGLDGLLNLPESGNRIPDVLDEARWELEFMLKMQVPEGKPHPFMVHHKIHDESWTALGLAPQESTAMKRFLRPVSTAATLNLAATAAQGARIFRAFDAAFADKCLLAAERAWKAAKANPELLISGSDNKGGGPYDDAQVSDDFYWAAAELFITTSSKEYLDFLLASPHHARFTSNAGSAMSAMNWARTDTLGKLSLLTTKSNLPKDELQRLKSQVTAEAEKYADVTLAVGHRVPLKGGAGGRYPWGSNSFALNNMLLLGIANDLAPSRKLLDSMVFGMDYLLGRNPMSVSYVTGYGTTPVENPHHRFWSHQVNEKYPKAPPGVVSGGPNSGLEDPYVKAAGLAGCAPQKCFVDNIEAWSVNEVTINWNAPLAWVAAYLDSDHP